MDAADVSPCNGDTDVDADDDDDDCCLWFCGKPPPIADGIVGNCDDTAKFTGLD